MYENTGVLIYVERKKRFRSRRPLLVNVFQWRRSFPENLCNISCTPAYVRVILLPHTCLSSHPCGGGRAYIAIRDSYALPLKNVCRIHTISFYAFRSKCVRDIGGGSGGQTCLSTPHGRNNNNNKKRTNDHKNSALHKPPPS